MVAPQLYFDQHASILIVKRIRFSERWSRDRGSQLIFRRQGIEGRRYEFYFIKLLDLVLFKKVDEVWLWRTYTNQ